MVQNINHLIFSVRLHEVDGPLLIQYKKMMDSAPQYFYHTLEDTLGLDLVSILQFTKALEGLKWKYLSDQNQQPWSMSWSETFIKGIECVCEINVRQCISMYCICVIQECALVM